MDRKGVIKLAEEISFRLKKKKKHIDHEWLINHLMNAFKVDKNKPK